MCLPYGYLITKNLEHVRFNFEEEEVVQDVTKIGEATLGLMWYENVNEEIFQKPHRGNKMYME